MPPRRVATGAGIELGPNVAGSDGANDSDRGSGARRAGGEKSNLRTAGVRELDDGRVPGRERTRSSSRRSAGVRASSDGHAVSGTGTGTSASAAAGVRGSAEQRMTARANVGGISKSPRGRGTIANDTFIIHVKELINEHKKGIALLEELRSQFCSFAADIKMHREVSRHEAMLEVLGQIRDLLRCGMQTLSSNESILDSSKALEPLRNEMVRIDKYIIWTSRRVLKSNSTSFCLPHSDQSQCRATRENCNSDDEEISEENSARRKAAQHLLLTGIFKKEEEFDLAWIAAWKAVRRKCRAQFGIYIPYMKDAGFQNLPQLPSAVLSAEAKRVISVYSLGLLHMKVGKHFQELFLGDRSGLKSAHGPEWAEEVRRLNRTLKAQVNDLGKDGEMVQFNGLLVKELPTEQEVQRLEDEF
ncbi:hypothetical protein FGB62_167g09 [Gracilaria domingensis]|nr:hypothetical protein FGB62_167g09 [Gracilaria domingensis]